MKSAILAGVAVVAMGFAATANAQVYNFSFSNATDSGSGQFDVSGTTVTGVSGSVDSKAIEGLSTYAGSDQQVNLVNPFVDFPGISFFTSADSYNLFSNPGDFLLKASVDPVGFPQNGQAITLNVSAVPEPSVWIMMLGGIAMMGAALRFGRRRNAVAMAA